MSEAKKNFSAAVLPDGVEQQSPGHSKTNPQSSGELLKDDSRRSMTPSKNVGIGIGCGIFILLILSIFFLFISWGGVLSMGTTAVATVLGIVALCGPGCCCRCAKRYRYTRPARNILTGLVCCLGTCVVVYLIAIFRALAGFSNPKGFVGSVEWLCVVILSPIALVLSLVFVLQCAKM